MPFARLNRLAVVALILLALILLALMLGAAQIPKRPTAKTELVTQTAKPGALTKNILYALGVAQGAMGHFQSARENFERIRKIDPSSPLGYAPVSETYLAEGQMDQALYWMRAAQELDPGNYELGGWMVLLNDSLEEYETAARWSEWLNDRVTNQSMPMAMQASHHYLAGNFELALQFSNLALNLGLPDRWNSDAVFMRVKRDEALASGNPGSGVEVFSMRHPELFVAKPEITAGNMSQATDLALLLKMAGRTRESQRLLAAVLDTCDRPFSSNGYLRPSLVPVKAEALAILGKSRESLDELRRIIDLGWRAHWRWKTDLNPNFIGVRQSGEFQAMVAELEADTEQQRSLARDIAIRGQFNPLPSPDDVM